MQIAFCSNFLSAHQKPLCDALYDLCGGEFRFIASAPLSEIRKSMGWQDTLAPYVIASYADEASYREAINYVASADVVLISGDEESDFLTTAIKNSKTIVFRCCERIYKQGRWRALSPRGLKRRWHGYYKQPKKNLYLLCSSAYAAGDFALLGAYLGRCYKWGYFTQVPDLDIERVLDEKEPDYIFWAGRMLELKRPEYAVRVAEYLKNRGIPFRMDLAGDGPQKEVTQCLLEEKGLTKQVRLLGGLAPEEVRAHMQKASVFIATSDCHEGWGAVIGEAMGYGCSVVACETMGATPFLIRDGVNGYSYRNKDTKNLCQKVETVLMDRKLQHRIGLNAHKTMAKVWNPDVAAQRLVGLVDAIKAGEKQPFSDGPCSKAHVFRKRR